MENITMMNLLGKKYDPSQWVLCTSNRALLMSAEYPTWLEQQNQHDLLQLEMTMERDQFVAETFDMSMREYALELIDETFEHFLSKLVD